MHMCLFYIVLAVLKKNYTRLCQCLPKDYMKTISKIQQLLESSDGLLSNIANLPTTDLINEAIIANLLISIPSDIAALQFCDLMEALTENKSSDITILKNGKFTTMNYYTKTFILYITYVTLTLPHITSKKTQSIHLMFHCLIRVH